MPNIVGTIEGSASANGQFLGEQNTTATGCFSIPARHTATGIGNSATSYPDMPTSLSFDASRCSSIYGSSNTVTPLSRTTRFYIKY